VAIAARLVRASTTIRPALARNAGGVAATKLAGVTQSVLGAAKHQIDAKRVSLVQAGPAARWTAGGGADGNGAARTGGSLATRSLPTGRTSLPL